MCEWKRPSYCAGWLESSVRAALALVLVSVVLRAPSAWGNPDPTPLPAATTPEPTAPAAVGTLVVVGTGAEPATLAVDGKEVGPLPWTGELPAGTHEIVARSAHGISATRKVVLPANGRNELELRVVENPSKLRVTTAVPDAIIRIDGIPYASGLFDGELAAGKHVVSVERQGYVPSTIKVDLQPDEQRVVDNVILERAAPMPPRAAPGKRGIYTIVAADGLLARPSNSFERACPANTLGGNCSSTVNMGGQLDVHVGYSFGIFGVEGFVIGGTNLTIAHQEFPSDISASQSPYSGIARKERYLIFEPIFGGGAAGRVSTQGKTFRLSTALGFGVAWRAAIVNRSVEAISDAGAQNILRRDSATLTPSGGGRAVPLLIWDSDLQLGDTPGTRIFLGIHGQVELGSEPTIDLGTGNLGYTATGEHLPLGGGALTVRRGPTFFFGPRLGVVTGF
jgi:hypothetical protein